MADDISVQLGAQIGQLQSGLSEATASIQQFVSTVQGGMNNATQSGSEFGSKMETALNIGVFLELEEVAKQALEAVQAAFEATIGKAEEFGLSNAKFAKIIGASSAEAAGLSQALQGVGSSSEQYEALALRLGQRIGEQETKFQSLHIATRDLNQELLGGKAAMDAVFSAMEKNPAEANAIAMTAFGRQGKAAFDIMRAGQEEIDKLNGIMRSMGVELGDTSQEAAKMEEIQNELRVAWDSVWIALGQRLMPILEKFAQVTGGTVSTALHDLGVILVSIIAAFVTLGTIVVENLTVISGAVAEMMDLMYGLGKVIYDGLTGNWSAIKGDVVGTWNDMEQTFKTTVDRMKGEFKGAQDILTALTTPPVPDKKGVYGSENGQNQAVHGTPKPDDGKAAELARKLADEKAAAAEREALEEIKIEEDKNNTLYAMGQKTTDEFIQQQVVLEDAKYKIQADFLQKKAANDAKDKLAEQKDLDALRLLRETHEEALLKIHDAALIKKQQSDRQDMEDSIKRLQENLTDQKAELDEEYKQGRLSIQEKSDAERQLTATVEREVLKRLDDEIAGLKPGTDAWKTAMKEREEAYRQFSNDIKKIDNEQTNEEMAKWKTLGNSIKSSFNGALNGMITGTEGWRQALGQVIDGVANAFLTMGEEIVENWIAQQIIKEVFTKTSTTTSALDQISSAAGVAGANTFAAISAIPVVGPELAPEAAGAAVSATLSFGSLAVAEKGMVLDRDRLVSAHEEEMILPSHLSRGIQDIIANGKSGGGDTHLHYGPTVNAPEQKGLKQMLIDESNTMLAWVNARMRDGSLKGHP